MEQQWTEEGFFLDEDDFEEKMNTEGAVFRQEHYRDGYFSGYQEKKIHYTAVQHPKEKAAIVICHGFCEFIHKYDELIWYLYRLGYSVYFIDHRGHGFSQREVEDPGKVYVDDFEEYVKDLKIFLDEIVKKQSPDAKLFLFAHSMGGAIGTLFLEQYPTYFKAVVLSSPMMEMSYGKIPKPAVKLLAAWSAVAHWNTRYVPGQHGYKDEYDFDGSSSLSEARYRYVNQYRKEVPQYRTYSATYAWARAALKAERRLQKDASKVQIPALLCQAGKDTMVRPKAQEEFAKKAKNTIIERYPDSKHEIFNAKDEERIGFYKRIFEFYEEML